MNETQRSILLTLGASLASAYAGYIYNDQKNALVIEEIKQGDLNKINTLEKQLNDNKINFDKITNALNTQIQDLKNTNMDITNSLGTCNLNLNSLLNKNLYDYVNLIVTIGLSNNINSLASIPRINYEIYLKDSDKRREILNDLKYFITAKLFNTMPIYFTLVDEELITDSTKYNTEAFLSRIVSYLIELINKKFISLVQI